MPKPNDKTYLVEVCSIAIVASDDVGLTLTLGQITNVPGGWDAWAVSPYDTGMLRRVGRNLRREAATQLVIACTKPYLANRAGDRS